MMVTILRCWWQKKVCLWYFLHVGDIPICQQHHFIKMWCWCPICYVGDMKFHLMPKSMKFFPSLNSSWGTQIGHQHHNMSECDVVDRYVMLETWNSTWYQIQSNFPHLQTDPEGLTSVTNIIIRPNVMLVTDIWCSNIHETDEIHVIGSISYRPVIS